MIVAHLWEQNPAYRLPDTLKTLIRGVGLGPAPKALRHSLWLTTP